MLRDTISSVRLVIRVVVFVLCAIAALTAVRGSEESYCFTTLPDATGAAAQFGTTDGIAIGPDGIIYVSDGGNAVIRTIDRDGNVRTLAGLAGAPGATDGKWADARFFHPGPMARGPDGSLYVSDYRPWSYCAIRKITPDGFVTTLAGGFSNETADGSGLEAEFASVSGLVCDSKGNVFTAENHMIRKITPAGVVSIFAGRAEYGGTIGKSLAFDIRQLAINQNDELFTILDQHKICKITPDGAVTVPFAPATSGPDVNLYPGPNGAVHVMDLSGLAVDSKGIVYAGGATRNRLYRMESEVNVTILAGDATDGTIRDGIGTDAALGVQSAVAIHPDGYLVVGGVSESVIRKVTFEGAVQTIAGVHYVSNYHDGRGAAFPVRTLSSVAVNRDGVVFSVDSAQHCIWQWPLTGEVTVFAGKPGHSGYADGAGAEARFRNPQGLVVLPSGDLLVADTSNHVIRRISGSGLVSTFAGVPGTSGAEDGPIHVARFYGPRSLRLDVAGNVFVDDAGNRALRRITPAGDVSTMRDVTPAERFAAYDSHGNAYFIIGEGSGIQRRSSNGISELFAGSVSGYGGDSLDGRGSAARFNRASAICIGPDDTLYVADGIGVGKIRKVTTDGTVTTIAGMSTNGVDRGFDGVGSDARFLSPDSIAVNESGVICVADFNEGDQVRRGVRHPAGAPTIEHHPSDTSAASGESARFTISALGNGPLAYRWEVRSWKARGWDRLIDNVRYSGTEGPNLVIRETPESADQEAYRCIVTNSLGSVTSHFGVLTVKAGVAPTITNQPESLTTVTAGGTVTLSIKASGTPPLAYRWRRFLIPINLADNSSAGTDTLVLRNVSPFDVDYFTGYDCVVCNSFGGVISATARLKVQSPAGEPSMLTNLSTRSWVGTGDFVQIAGVVMEGRGAKSLLFRANGPTLRSDFNLPNGLAEPIIELYTSSTRLARNDGWANSADIAAAGRASGAYAWANTSEDAALLPSLGPGAYTALVSGENGTAGLGLVEIFDASASVTSARLVNLSARAYVGTGDNVAIAGFAIEGKRPKNVLIRASGPSMRLAFELERTLPAPRLKLFSGSTFVNGNTGWKRDPRISQAAQHLGAFAWE